MPSVVWLLSLLLWAGPSVIIAASPAFPDCSNGPLSSNLVCNSSANYFDRAKALVAALTLEEIINNTANGAPGVPRLGIPPYQWWSEALPGVTFNGTPGTNFCSATSFPQPILMSAAFDDDLIYQVAQVVSTEARAFNNEGLAGLDYFTPNINPFKDPRWGRGQETPGEDPYHISRYVYQLIIGLQGGLNPQPYLKIAADCKHFVAYDLEYWYGFSRFNFDANVTLQDLAEYYTPSFQSCVRDAKAVSAMCSYNSMNGLPTCANSYLLQTIIRDFYGLGENQWIVSDCDAVDTIVSGHNFTSSLANASALALKAGTDLDCGTTYAQNLGQALNQSLVSQAGIETALTRLYASLVRLGYFDPASSQPYRQLGWDNVNTPEAQALAFTVATEGMVLLKNSGILPLSRGTRTIAVIGPMMNATTQMQGNYQGTSPFLTSPLLAFQSLGFGFNVLSAQGTGITSDIDGGTTTALAAATSSDVVIYIGGIDNSVEAEGLDRTNITWPDNQLNLLAQLIATGKPLIVVQMGGGQLDDTPLVQSDAVKAILWAGYPGQSGGIAIAHLIVGLKAPAGRLPITQYPGNYVNQIPMTNMNLRPDSSTNSPGRTYKWYGGTPVFEFGFGLHYTTFDVSWDNNGAPKSTYSISSLISAAGNVKYQDLALLGSFSLDVKNTGNVTSDYVALVFMQTSAGPSPAPLKQLVSYARAQNISPGQTQTLSLNITLGSLARVEQNGDSNLYPGSYDLWVDTTPNRMANTSFTLTGDRTRVIAWPQPS
ncbi:glycoside hydrolase family 3 protein [Cantharellus anzutake]|uniref:glycoside hydrolase family 3 protein n=1 Tax=Cantharellus anzutake TaxID=1750568 RepID=UPI0019036ABE|nr:glycoside hydrolase family 3 protein [Cantharellus anzutake]KAF8321392.1 glycoside hydrolase family 3 protein [Cantharellus anzutake]